MTTKTVTAAMLGCALAFATNAPAQDRAKISCTATAGLAKHEAATSTTATERTGAYDVTVVSSGATVRISVEPKKPVSAGQATKIAAPIEKVLLRSPFKSEATALPARESQAGPSLAHTATFDLDALRALPAGDFNVVVVTPEGERVCQVDESARRKLVAGR